MLQLSRTLIGRNVLSLRNGQIIGRTMSVIINPDSLKIEGIYCAPSEGKNQLILLPLDIRDVLAQGVVVDDIEALTDPAELVRLHKIIAYEYTPLGKQVIDTNKTKLGKVSDYAYNTDNFYVQKIYASQSILRNFLGGNVGIDRSQIQEVTPKKIIVDSTLNTLPVGAPAA